VPLGIPVHDGVGDDAALMRKQVRRQVGIDLQPVGELFDQHQPNRRTDTKTKKGRPSIARAAPNVTAGYIRRADAYAAGVIISSASARLW
jgi:hypothetical protein